MGGAGTYSIGIEPLILFLSGTTSSEEVVSASSLFRACLPSFFAFLIGDLIMFGLW